MQLLVAKKPRPASATYSLWNLKCCRWQINWRNISCKTVMYCTCVEYKILIYNKQYQTYRNVIHLEVSWKVSWKKKNPNQLSKFVSKSCKDLHEVQLTTISKRPDPPTLSLFTQGNGHFPNKVKLDKQGGVIHSIHIFNCLSSSGLW